MRRDSHRLAELLIPIIFLAIFAVISLIYVAFFYRPRVTLVSETQSRVVYSPQEAENVIYGTNEYPREATFMTASGRALQLDLTALGMTYFKPEDEKFLSYLADESFMGKLNNFIHLRDSRTVHVNRHEFMLNAEQVRQWLDLNAYVLKEPAIADTLYAATDTVRVVQGMNGYTIDKDNFIQSIMDIQKTKNFTDISVLSESLAPTAPADDLTAYTTLLASQSVDMPNDFIYYQNIKNALRSGQNIFVANGATINLDDYIGALTTDNGYVVNTATQTSVVGGGVELFVDGVLQAGRQAGLQVVAYKGASFQTGEDLPNFTGLILKNETGADIVISTTVFSNKLTIVIAKKG